MSSYTFSTRLVTLLWTAVISINEIGPPQATHPLTVHVPAWTRAIHQKTEKASTPLQNPNHSNIFTHQRLLSVGPLTFGVHKAAPKAPSMNGKCVCPYYSEVGAEHRALFVFAIIILCVFIIIILLLCILWLQPTEDPSFHSPLQWH